MNRPVHADRMAGRLPQAMQGGENLARLFAVFDQEMALMETGAKRLMRSRWYRHARGWFDAGDNLETKRETELGQLAALVGFSPGRDEAPAEFRRRLARYVGIHRRGLGSARAILQLAALVYRAESDPPVIWKKNVAAAEFAVPGPSGQRLLRLELIENPVETEEFAFAAMVPGKTYEMTNHTLDAAIPRLVIQTGKQGQVVSVPMLTHLQSSTRILYVGKISPGAELHLQNGAPPRLLRNDAVQSGGFCFDHPDSVFDTPSGTYQVRFGGPRILMTGQGSQFNRIDSRFGPATFAAFGTRLPFPALVPGKNQWVYQTVRPRDLGAYLADRPDAEELLKNAAADDAPPIDLALSWKGRRPSCFSLKIPGDYVPSCMDSFSELQAALNRMLQYGRAAGVHARLEPVVPFSESVHPKDRAWPVDSRLSFPEGAGGSTLQDPMAPAGISIRLQEPLAAADRLGSSGVFDNAHFGHALFEKEEEGN